MPLLIVGRAAVLSTFVLATAGVQYKLSQPAIELLPHAPASYH